jgi:hypothetical protein
METLYKDHRFSTYVRKNFDFLEKEYDFKSHHKALGYIKGDLELEFHYGRGEIEIVFFVQRDDEIFRPYVSRAFDLPSVIKQPKNGKIQYPTNLSYPLMEMTDVDIYLSYCASILKEYGKSILSGNMEIFEKIHLMRRTKA